MAPPNPAAAQTVPDGMIIFSRKPGRILIWSRHMPLLFFLNLFYHIHKQVFGIVGQGDDIFNAVAFFDLCL